MQSIFISSTFRDMQYERDILHGKVLRRLRDHFRGYGQTVDFSDLRWGVDSMNLSEEESAVKIIQVCFGEIDRARPYMIVLLGDRYGWVPDVKKIQTHIQLQDLQVSGLSGKSITEMEIDHGCLRTDIRDTEVLFYFRKISNLSEMKKQDPDTYAQYAAGSLGDQLKIRRLKSDIRRRFPDRVREYTLSWDTASQSFKGLDDFSDLVYEDICRCMQRRLGETTQRTWQQDEMLSYWFNFETDAFSLTKDQLNTGFHTDAVQQLLQNTLPDSVQSLWLSGDDRYKLDRYIASTAILARTMGHRVIAYDCGSTLFSSDIRNMLRYLIWHISGEDVSDNTLSHGQLGELLQNAMSRYHTSEKAPLIVVLRNIDALTRSDLSLWYPRKPGTGIRFLISGTQGSIGAGIRSRNVNVIFDNRGGFPPQEYIQLQLKKHHKQIDAHVMEILLKKTEGKSARYTDALLNRLTTFGKTDYDQIQRSGGGIHAISGYLRQVAEQHPDSLSRVIRNSIDMLKTELSPNFTDSVLALFSVLPNSITVEHLEWILQSAGLQWNSLDFTFLRQHLQHLISISLDGSLKISDKEYAAQLQNIYLLEKDLWSDRLSEYMQSLPFEDDLYKKQYLLLAFERGDTWALWKYLLRAGEDDSYAFLMLRQILKNPNSLKWLEKNFENLGKTDMQQLLDHLRTIHGDVRNGKDSQVIAPAAISKKDFEKLTQWCIKRLYPWLKSEELLSDAWGPIWEMLLTAAEERYAAESNHTSNQLCFDVCFQLGEMIFLHGDRADARKHLLRALQLAQEDMERWPNKVRKQLMGMPLTEDDYRRAQKMAPEGIDSDMAIHLIYGTEVQDATTGVSYSSYVRIIHRYLADIFRTLGDADSAKRHYEKADSIARMLDPNPNNQAESEICDGIKVIMPWTLDGQPKQRPAKNRYKPDYRRNTAIRLAKDATGLMRSEQYEEAVGLFLESNDILYHIHEDGQTGELYDLDGIAEDFHEIRIRISSECLRDLGLNYTSLFKIYYQQEKYDLCRSTIREGLAFCLQFDEIRNSRESKRDLEEYYFAALHYYHFMEDEELKYETACSLQNACLESVQAGSAHDDSTRDHMELACDVILRGIESHPARGETYLQLLVDRSNSAMFNRDFSNYLSLANHASLLLKTYLENRFSWKVQNVDAEEALVSIVKSACDISKAFRNWSNFRYFAERTSKIANRIRFPSAQYDCRFIFTELAMEHFANGEYAQAAQWLIQAYEIMEPITPEWNMPLSLFQDMIRLISAYSESGQTDKAAALGEKAIRYAREVLRRGYGPLEQSQGITRQAWVLELHRSMAEMYLNLGINAGRLGSEQNMHACFSKSMEYLDKLGSEEADFQRNVRIRIQAFKNPEAGILSGESRQQELAIRGGLDQLNSLFERAFSRTCSRSETEQIADEAAAILSRLEQLPNFEVLLSADLLLRYYYYCGNLCLRKGNAAAAYALTKKAVAHADSCKDTELLSRAFSDLCAMTENRDEQRSMIRKAIALQESLLSQQKLRDRNDLAMSYYNYAVLSLQVRDMETAKEYAQKARALWQSLVNAGRTDCRQYLQEASRLCGIFSR